ncbi:MAG: metallophosphoesterase [Bacteroidales bacterium]
MIYSGTVNPNSFVSSWFILLIFLEIFPLLFFSLYWLLFILPFQRFCKFNKSIKIVGWSICIVVFCSILYGGIVGRTHLVVNKKAVVSSRLPKSFDGLKIAHISDLHLGSFNENPEFIQKVVETINSQKTDLIFFTGDLVNSNTSEIAPFLEILKSLTAKDGVYSVLGNHDYLHYNHWNSEEERLIEFEKLNQFQKDCGWILLNNENHIIRRGNDSIAIIGVENRGEKRFGKQGDLTKAMKRVSASCFSLLLSHNPHHWEEEVIPLSDIDLTFSGHTHAMQTQVGNYSPASWVYPHWNGLYKNNNQFLHVNRGIGYVLVPMRVGAYPEITIIELRNTTE